MFCFPEHVSESNRDVQNNGVHVFKRRKPDDQPPEAGDIKSAAGASPGAGTSSSDGPVRLGVPPAPSGAAPGQQAASGFGVPPFRPSHQKEAEAVSRAPFANTPSSTAVPPRPGAPAAAASGHPAGKDTAERRTLVVGRGISVQGTVQDAERLVVEGTVEATMIRATELSVSLGGVFKGEVEVEDAEVAGTIDGTLTATASLIVRASGKVLGTARCRRLQVEDGGQITGSIQMLTDGTRPVDAPRPDASAPRPAVDPVPGQSGE
ncbi:Hypothetical protein GbCGDNIH7_0402 [Granulibacter bethesdensis]|nr:Hypothetical protein GbCGDNIH7_0402 [Granulibacter bethesdensis]